MGVPAFFRWLCSRNPKILVEAQENPEDYFSNSLNPEIDNLYLDMNGIIHPCSHPEGTGIPIPISLHDMFLNVFNYVDRLIDLIRPQKLLYLAIDGVAPRAKMNQQRSRRFRSAQESIRALELKKQLREFWQQQGMQDPRIDTYIENSFDQNQITPGTDFMHQLTFALQYYIYERMNNNPLFQNLVIIFSDASIPGEGEHKILQYIRDQRSSQDYNPNIKHCIYGADADLIMLALSTHEPWFYIIRETIGIQHDLFLLIKVQQDDKVCTHCSQKGHYFMDCRKKDAQNDIIDEIIEQKQPQKVRTIQVNFQFIRLYVLREYLYLELTELKSQLKFEWDLERIIDDFNFMCFFVGNDFLPHIPCLKITEGGLDFLMIVYKLTLPDLNDYLTNCGTLNLKAVERFISNVGCLEEDLLKGQEKKMEFVKRRQQENRENQDNIAKGKLSESNQHLPLLDQFKQKLKEKLEEERIAEINSAQQMQSQNQSKAWNFLSVKQRYYEEKFGIKPAYFPQFIKQLKQSYMEGLQWTLKYYYQGCIDWGWFYPYHYAPFAQDLLNLRNMIIEFNEEAIPFTPYQQLMAVLPPKSAVFLPESYHFYMTNSKSPIADFYPCDFFVDLKGKKFAWLGEIILPFIDEERLVQSDQKALLSVSTKSDVDRNRRGVNILFVKHNLINLKNEEENIYFGNLPIQGRIRWLKRFEIGHNIEPPMATQLPIKNNQIMSFALLNSKINHNKDFVQNSLIQGCIQPPNYLDEYYMKECEGNKRFFGGDAVRRVILSSLNIKGIMKTDTLKDDRNDYPRQNTGYRRRGQNLQDLDNIQKQIKYN